MAGAPACAAWSASCDDRRRNAVSGETLSEFECRRDLRSDAKGTGADVGNQVETVPLRRRDPRLDQSLAFVHSHSVKLAH